MFGFSMYELLFFSLILLLLFGKRLPGLMHSLGKSVTEFKRGVSDTSAEATELSN